MPDNNRTPYAVELDLARDAAEEAGALVLERQRTIQSIEFKGDTDLVTDVDRASEALIVERIQRRFPDDTILAEEGSGHGLGSDERRIWLIDPLDGRTNYAHGFPIYAVSIALVVDERPAVGVVHV
ncbi:MAG: inositol monophosphatase family protein, partial [Chloroflexota bacterium]